MAGPVVAVLVLNDSIGMSEFLHHAALSFQ